MTIDEAIRELQTINHDGFTVTRLTEREALQLGIEALRRVKEARRPGTVKDVRALSGETEE